jgi:hypothetical protein
MGKIRRHTQKKQKGGMKTFVAAPLNYGNFETYPGVTNHGGNHYAYNNYPTDPYTGDITNERDWSIYPNKYTGGYVYNNSLNKRNKTYLVKNSQSRTMQNRKKRNSRTRTRSHSRHSRRSRNKSKPNLYIKKGGLGPLLSDAVMGTRVVGNNISNVYNTLAGYPQSVSPLPYKDQLLPPT